MTKQVFSRNEFIPKVEISEKTLQEWENKKVIQPAGFTGDHVPFYSEELIERARRIQQLIGLGYELEEIQRIIKKVGLPRTVSEKNDHRGTDIRNYLTVGGLAERVGVSPRTIKHWEDKGIIEPDTRSDGGFRFYAEHYVYLCKLIRDLQLFGYTLDQIKKNSDMFRDFLAIQENVETYLAAETEKKLERMLREIETLFEKMDQFREGIQRWESLVKKKKKEIMILKNQNKKRESVTVINKEERVNA